MAQQKSQMVKPMHVILLKKEFRGTNHFFKYYTLDKHFKHGF